METAQALTARPAAPDLLPQQAMNQLPEAVTAFVQQMTTMQTNSAGRLTTECAEAQQERARRMATRIAAQARQTPLQADEAGET